MSLPIRTFVQDKFHIIHPICKWVENHVGSDSDGAIHFIYRSKVTVKAHHELCVWTKSFHEDWLGSKQIWVNRWWPTTWPGGERWCLFHVLMKHLKNSREGWMPDTTAMVASFWHASGVMSTWSCCHGKDMVASWKEKTESDQVFKNFTVTVELNALNFEHGLLLKQTNCWYPPFARENSIVEFLFCCAVNLHLKPALPWPDLNCCAVSPLK